MAVAAFLSMSWAGAGTTSGTMDGVVHPSVLVTENDVLALRDILTTDTYRRKVYEGAVKAVADDWVTRSITIPPRSGYYHDFVCTDGTRLVWPDELQHCEPIPPGQSYSCPACGGIYSSGKLDGAVRYLQHTTLMAAARNLALVGVIENEHRYLEKAAEVLKSYAAVYPGRHTAVTRGGILYQSLDEAVHFIYLAQAYDLIAGSNILSPADDSHIKHDLLWESAEGLIACGTGGNWGSWHLSAVGVIGFATGHKGYADYGVTQFKKQIAEQLGGDGLWPESVHTYHFYPMRGFLQLAEAALANGVDLYRWETGPGRSLQAMFAQPVYYAYPNLQLPAINDGWFWSFLPLDVYELGYNRLRLPELGWVVRESRQRNTSNQSRSPDALNVWSFLHGIPVPDDISTPALKSTNFQTLGVCTLRNDQPGDKEVMLTFDYGRYLGHGQADKMGITLYANNRLLMADYGTPSYGSDILPYYRGTSSHNTLMIDGKNQPHTKHAALLAFVDEPELKVAVAETTEVAKGVTWRRGVFLTADYALVIDQMKSDDFHQYDCLLHCVGDDLVVVEPRRLHQQTTASAMVPYFDIQSRAASSRSGASVTWIDKRSAVLSAHLAAWPVSETYIASCPADSGSTTIPAVIHRVKGDDALIASLLNTTGAGGNSLRIENNKVVVQRELRSDTFTLSNDGKQILVELADGNNHAPPLTITILENKPIRTRE